MGAFYSHRGEIALGLREEYVAVDREEVGGASTRGERLVDSSFRRYAEAFMETRYEHIMVDEDRVARITGTMVKVVELVAEQRAYGWSPEEIHFQHPYLTLGQIYSALAYYWDHREELDLDIERRLERVDRLRHELQPGSLVARVKDRGSR
jgi:uncharacterized protein (DUF433 family)